MDDDGGSIFHLVKTSVFPISAMQVLNAFELFRPQLTGSNSCVWLKVDAWYQR